jgi:hypothetical protein
VTDARQENARMLAAILGVGEDEAADRLNRPVVVTVGTEPDAQSWAHEIIALLSLTVRVTRDPSEELHAELVVGSTRPQTSAPRLHAAIDALGATVATEPVRRGPAPPHPLLMATAACAVAAATVSLVIDDSALPAVRLPLVFDFKHLGIPPAAFDRPIDLTGAVLVGAGAVGHGFLRALRHLRVYGTLPIIDPKHVGAGNFNRCAYLKPDDEGKDKAVVLASRAQGDFPHLTLLSRVEEFRAFCKREGPPPAAIVTVDSRRARRSIQSELPGRVLDASTTDIRSVVVHSHRQPTQHACLSCIYRHVPEENARERSIAEGLGIDIDMVKEGFISKTSATAIGAAHPEIDPQAILGMAYDSLFKQLCAAQTLLTPDSRQVLAPFAFVSALAGALLTIELLRSEQGVADSNYWVVDPWGAPIARRRVLRPRIEGCEFCGNPAVQPIAQELWGRFAA